MPPQAPMRAALALVAFVTFVTFVPFFTSACFDWALLDEPLPPGEGEGEGEAGEGEGEAGEGEGEAGEGEGEGCPPSAAPWECLVLDAADCPVVPGQEAVLDVTATADGYKLWVATDHFVYRVDDDGTARFADCEDGTGRGIDAEGFEALVGGIDRIQRARIDDLGSASCDLIPFERPEQSQALGVAVFGNSAVYVVLEPGAPDAQLTWRRRDNDAALFSVTLEGSGAGPGRLFALAPDSDDPFAAAVLVRFDDGGTFVAHAIDDNPGSVVAGPIEGAPATGFLGVGDVAADGTAPVLWVEGFRLNLATATYGNVDFGAPQARELPLIAGDEPLRADHDGQCLAIAGNDGLLLTGPPAASQVVPAARQRIDRLVAAPDGEVWGVGRDAVSFFPSDELLAEPPLLAPRLRELALPATRRAAVVLGDGRLFLAGAGVDGVLVTYTPGTPGTDALTEEPAAAVDGLGSEVDFQAAAVGGALGEDLYLVTDTGALYHLEALPSAALPAPTFVQELGVPTNSYVVAADSRMTGGAVSVWLAHSESGVPGTTNLAISQCTIDIDGTPTCTELNQPIGLTLAAGAGPLDVRWVFAENHAVLLGTAELAVIALNVNRALTADALVDTVQRGDLSEGAAVTQHDGCLYVMPRAFRATIPYALDPLTSLGRGGPTIAAPLDAIPISGSVSLVANSGGRYSLMTLGDSISGGPCNEPDFVLGGPARSIANRFSSVAAAPDGSVYVADDDGRVWRVPQQP